MFIHQVPHIRVTGPAGAHEVVLNAAALMEGFALLVELSQVFNALGNRIDPDDVPSAGPEYWAALEFAFASKACSVSNRLPTTAVCIHLALMYDPFVLFDSPSIEVPTDGRPADQHPGRNLH